MFETDSFVPAAKLKRAKQYSIVTDHLGTPVMMLDEQGEKNWQADLDVYGRAKLQIGRTATSCPFRYQGQYEDAETGLYYNRFRYYSPDEGIYISQDPIGLAGSNPTLYGYVSDVNMWVDVLGLKIIRLRHYTSRNGFNGIMKDMKIKTGDQNAVFATKAKGKRLSMRDAQDKFKLKPNKARDCVEFNIDDGLVELRKNSLGVEEYKIKGDVELDSETTDFVKGCS